MLIRVDIPPVSQRLLLRDLTLEWDLLVSGELVRVSLALRVRLFVDGRKFGLIRFDIWLLSHRASRRFQI
jgi:hypothetical protein